MASDIRFWHERYKQQTIWTQSLRPYLLDKLTINPKEKGLEIGCGTGAMLQALHRRGFSDLTGIDTDRKALAFARKTIPAAALIQADGAHLPFSTGTYPFVFCHFLFLWVSNPLAVLAEMKRVTKKNGAVIAFAEPDYGGRIDFPAILENSGTQQTNSLLHQGADPLIGRKLASLFIDAGFRDAGYGVLGGEWQIAPKQSSNDFETDVLELDLKQTSIPARNLKTTLEAERASREQGKRVLFVPVFYAWGRK